MACQVQQLAVALRERERAADRGLALQQQQQAQALIRAQAIITADSEAAAVVQARRAVDAAQAEALQHLATAQLVASRAEASSGAGLQEALAESNRLRTELASARATLMRSSGGISSLGVTSRPRHATGRRTTTAAAGTPGGSLHHGPDGPLGSLSLTELRMHVKLAAEEMRQARAQQEADRVEAAQGLRQAHMQLETERAEAAKELRQARAQHEAERAETARVRAENQQLVALLSSAHEVRGGMEMMCTAVALLLGRGQLPRRKSACPYLLSHTYSAKPPQPYLLYFALR